MVPRSLVWELLQFLVTEDVSEHPILVRDSFICFGLSDNHLVSLDSGGEYCLVSIISSKYDGQLLVVDPSFGPIDSWLHTSKPWVS